jgi:hypothetical protein
MPAIRRQGRRRMWLAPGDVGFLRAGFRGQGPLLRVVACVLVMGSHKSPEWSESTVLGVYKSFPRPTFPHADFPVRNGQSMTAFTQK